MPMKTRFATRGFTLLEVMVALMIFSIGLLGLAGLQASGMTSSKTADLRATAIILAHDMAERIRTNERGTPTDYDAVDTNTISTSTVPSPNCISSAGCTSSAAIAAWDLFEWANLVTTSLPSGRGTVTRANATSPYIITVMWDEDRSGAAGKSFRLDMMP